MSDGGIRTRPHYRVVGAAETAVACCFATEAAAVEWARKLAARDPGARFYVTRAVAVVCTPKPETTVEWLR